MKRLFSITAALVLMLGLIMSFPPQTSAQDAGGTVTIYSTQLIDSSGYYYGAHFYVSTTAPDGACVAPFVASSSNVNGSVVPLIQLSANESGVSIGEFISANESQPWSVNVQAKWRNGGC